MKSCLIIAGEKSGEEHALSFFNQLKEKNPDFSFFGVGGDELESAGLDLVYHLKDFSTWGISEAIKRIPFYYKALSRMEEEVAKRNCKVAILIDFQTYNMKLAERLKKKGVKILYYVAPQAWAWKSWRTKVLERTVDTLFCILPFEKKWFMDRGVSKAISIEHPVLTHNKVGVNEFKRGDLDIENGVLKVLLLPGSRNFEVKSLLPLFSKVISKLKETRTVEVSIVKSSSVRTELYEPYESLFNRVYQNEDLTEAIKSSQVALASSGTVNLTCALYSLPTVVGYTGSLLNQFIYHTFVSYDGFISIANIVHEREVFPEFIAENLSEYNMMEALKKILSSNKDYQERVSVLDETKKLVSGDDIDISSYLSEKLNESYLN
ncbi:lipid-A-disaccharide synthase [Bacteriovorax sp. Seq25_V]|uniref:lipid-A-disaccharide synthase n=1 Tax=Bacteriovorax sp. Seq25_V TaxID=1201288 RepID=UPI00038A143A|nr:lipid-A-disaccharide synthase [Bacteriovorax sp. Seq25_V]EQC47266.1 lipid-A-disaccharide synthase [Bacteriovorax sp. Seq25_V]